MLLEITPYCRTGYYSGLGLREPVDIRADAAEADALAAPFFGQGEALCIAALQCFCVGRVVASTAGADGVDHVF